MSDTLPPQDASSGETRDEASGLSDAQRKTLKSMLENSRAQLRAQLRGLAGEAEEAAYPGYRDRTDNVHALENAEISEELNEHAKQEIELIDAALIRIAAGSYGVCCDCDAAIGFARLEAYPMARRCIACKRVYEKGR